MIHSERILLVEDDAPMRASCRHALEGDGLVVVEAGSAREAEPILLREVLDLVVTDLRMPHGGGKQVLKMVKNICPEVPVLVITAYPSVESAIDAFRDGVSDYLLKPFTASQLLESINGALRAKRAVDRANLLRQIGAAPKDMPELLGSSASFRAMLAMIRRVAPLDGNVLVVGETGSGKELVSRAVHRFSKRSAGPLVAVNCASIPDNLIEAELFGYEKGAFTGADTTKRGLFEEASGGTLFLDEVAELSAAAQAKLLRCIEDKAVRHVGGVKTHNVDIRIVAATHKDLAEEVREGRFREDLLYRLAVLELMVPPLRERPEDVLTLAVRFLDQLIEHDDREIVGFCDAALQRLSEYPWPGNVRELQNAVQRAYAIADGPTILEDDLVLRGALNVSAGPTANMPKRRSSAMAKFERQHVLDALERHDGNVTHTAKSLGIHRTTLQRLMRRLGIAPN